MTSSLQSQHLSSYSPDLLGDSKNGLRDSEYRYFLYMLSRCSTMKQFFYSHSRMAKDMGCSVASIKRWINVLKEKGFLFVTNQGYKRPNIYTIAPEYTAKKSLFYSVYKNFLSLSLLMAPRPSIQKNELLLRNNEIIYPAKGENHTKKEGSMFQLNEEQVKERRTYPQWAQDKALAIYNRKAAHGVKIINHANFFMGILRSEAAAKQRPADKQRVEKKDIEKNKKISKPVSDKTPELSKEEIIKGLKERIEKSRHHLSTLQNNQYADSTIKYITTDIEYCIQEITRVDPDYEFR